MAATPSMTIMIDAVRKAARGVQRDFGELSNLQVSVKGPGDYVTAADKRCEKTLRAELEKARPGYGFVMEEGGIINGTDPDHRFIIDPIDGTHNFMHAIPFFAISVALERKGEIVAGITYNPITDEMYTAEKGAGAFVNNKRMRVASRKDIHECMIGCGLPHRGLKGQAEQRAELAVLQAKAIGLRAMGSATLELAAVAAGRYDAFWHRHLKPWDLAAGILLVREAGGFTSDCDSEANPLTTGNIVACNADLLPLMKRELATAKTIVGA